MNTETIVPTKKYAHVEKLVLKFKETESDSDFNEIIRNFTPLVEKSLRKYYLNYDEEDARQKLHFIIFECIKKFNPLKGVQFTTYCMTALHNEMVNIYERYTKDHFPKLHTNQSERGQMVSLNQSLGEESPDTLLDMLSDSTDLNKELESKDLITKFLDKVREMDNRAHLILTRLLEGHSFTEISKEIGLTDCRCREIIHQYRPLLTTLLN